jgi:hypothetical protein
VDRAFGYEPISRKWMLASNLTLEMVSFTTLAKVLKKQGAD